VELLSLLDHMSSPQFLVGFVLLDLWCFIDLVFPFVFFLLAIVWSVLLITSVIVKLVLHDALNRNKINVFHIYIWSILCLCRTLSKWVSTISKQKQM
jgi:hypothetical protein